MRTSVLAMILAGGEGTRLAPLTDQRAKPAVPFGGKYRIIDFVLSNFVNSGIDSIFVLTQFKSQSLMEHIINGWNLSNAQQRVLVDVFAGVDVQAVADYQRGRVAGPCVCEDRVSAGFQVDAVIDDILGVGGGDGRRERNGRGRTEEKMVEFHGSPFMLVNGGG